MHYESQEVENYMEKEKDSRFAQAIHLKKIKVVFGILNSSIHNFPVFL